MNFYEHKEIIDYLKDKYMVLLESQRINKKKVYRGFSEMIDVIGEINRNLGERKAIHKVIKYLRARREIGI